MKKEQKESKLYWVVVTRVESSDYADDKERIVFQDYRKGKSEKDVINRLKFMHPWWKNYDDDYGSVSVEYRFELTRQLYIRKLKKVEQLNLFDFDFSKEEEEKKKK